MIVFAASDEVPFMTGEIVRVNGGKTAWGALYGLGLIGAPR